MNLNLYEFVFHDYHEKESARYEISIVCENIDVALMIYCNTYKTIFHIEKAEELFEGRIELYGYSSIEKHFEYFDEE